MTQNYQLDNREEGNRSMHTCVYGCVQLASDGPAGAGQSSQRHSSYATMRVWRR
jgi:hypothetical protein